MPSEGVEKSWKRLGLIAGGGALPVRIAEAEKAAGRPPFVVRITADKDAFAKFDHADMGIAEVGGVIKRLKAEGCDAVCFAGQVLRPNFADLRPDWRGAALLPKVVSAARKGDGAIIDVIVSAFEQEGFTVVGAEEAAGGLLMAAGSLGRHAPATEDLADIAKGAALVGALGPFDVAQGAVVRRGFVLAIEAAEGTDAMLDRCASLPEELKGFEPGHAGRKVGVLVKTPKPEQELRVDLPTLGVRTVEKAAAAGLAGIAVMAERALVVDRDAVREAADEAGLFVYGFRAEELPQ
ncbi:LpxI family protein [Parvularcula lutaonensis]|uniref:LpxI family protein n=1 Tax=Parvularcula lutaonensis TaxID=491923 RepID=A0ABV7MFK4_9PROT|nr:UDP-2,3-diacylglucosamine diphosphatase LpxI [Parvularcula lutaonensis]GGY54454.1 UDP-2,3-diacylglucosamine pyrophosphatase [Parvularcula lutaonensis]